MDPQRKLEEQHEQGQKHEQDIWERDGAQAFYRHVGDRRKVSRAFPSRRGVIAA